VTGQFGRKALRTPPPSGGCGGAEYQRFSFGAPARSGSLQRIRICSAAGPSRRNPRHLQIDFTASGALPRRLADRSPAAGRDGRPAAPAARCCLPARHRSGQERGHVTQWCSWCDHDSRGAVAAGAPQHVVSLSPC